MAKLMLAALTGRISFFDRADPLIPLTPKLIKTEVLAGLTVA